MPDAVLSDLLFRPSLTMRMTGYVVSVAKPSGAGLKLDLDRFRRDVEERRRLTHSSREPSWSLRRAGTGRTRLELSRAGS